MNVGNSNKKTPTPYLSIEAQMLKFCVVPLYFMHPACALRKTFIPLPVTADTGSLTWDRVFAESSAPNGSFRLLLQGQFTHLPLPSHTYRWLSGCFRSATLPFHRISYEITYKFIIDQVPCQPLTRLFSQFVIWPAAKSRYATEQSSETYYL